MAKKDIEIMSGKTDEREQGEWKSRYTDPIVKRKQILEATYIVFITILSFVALLLNYIGIIDKWFNVPEANKTSFFRIFACSFSGLLGGAIFDMKWFYKSIAHGFWNADRVYWRIFTPIISLSFAFCLGSVFSETIIVHGNDFSAVTLGFLSGYFSDEAVGKMAEVAKVLFNTKSSSNNKDSDCSVPSENNTVTDDNEKNE